VETSVKITQMPYGVFKWKDGWRFRHYGPAHEGNNSEGPFKSRDAAMVALLTSLNFPVEGG
jgi:hypothetical protein